MRRAFLRLWVALAVLALPHAAQAGDLTVVVAEKGGKPVGDAVAVLEAAPAKPVQAGKFLITQKDLAFKPLVLVIPVGSTVDFGNLDRVRHHVYSFSPARKFELKLFGHGETRPVRFDRPGLVAVGCNIHDSMQAFIKVVDSPFAAKTGADGRVVLRGVPPGNWTLRIYHPRLRAPGNELAMPVEIRTSKVQPVEVKLRAAAPARHDY